MKTLMWRLIWVCTVYLCPIYRALVKVNHTEVCVLSKALRFVIDNYLPFHLTGNSGNDRKYCNHVVILKQRKVIITNAIVPWSKITAIICMVFILDLRICIGKYFWKECGLNIHRNYLNDKTNCYCSRAIAKAFDLFAVTSSFILAE